MWGMSSNIAESVRNSMHVHIYPNTNVLFKHTMHYNMRRLLTYPRKCNELGMGTWNFATIPFEQHLAKLS